jgi:hypothetical protein
MVITLDSRLRGVPRQMELPFTAQWNDLRTTCFLYSSTVFQRPCEGSGESAALRSSCNVGTSDT